MSVVTGSIKIANNTDDEFRAWGLWISDALTTAGIPKTADSGQVDWGTVTKAATQYTAAGYEIRRFNDALQATAPVYFKIEFGAGHPDVTAPSIWITIGTGSDGAGVITGPNTSRIQVHCLAGTANFPARFSGDASGFAVSLQGGNASSAIALVMERTHAWNGTDTNLGALFLCTTTSGSAWRQTVYLFDGGSQIVEANIGALFPTGTTASDGVNTMFMPVYPNVGVMLNPFVGAVGAFKNNLTESASLTLTHYGVSRQYFANPTTHFNSFGSRGDAAHMTFLMRDW